MNSVPIAKSIQSFRDIIPSDNRLDLNSATEQQLHTLPGLNKVKCRVIIFSFENFKQEKAI